MQTGKLKLAHIAATTVVLATALTLPAVAEAHWKHHHYHHHHYRALTVSRDVPPPVADPFHGPAAIFTAPIALAGAFVSVPFRAAGEFFPATGATPLVIIGAPVHFAGQVVQYPFYAVGTAFGAGQPVY